MWKEWFTYSKQQRFGIFTLSLLLIIIALLPTLNQTFFEQPLPITNADDFHKIDSFVNALTVEKKKPKPRFSMIEEELPAKPEPELFPFDPNTVSTSELMRLGFSRRQAAVIENYRQKGGEYNAAKDFAKMYVVDSTLFAKLEPYIQIAPKQNIDSLDQATDSSTVSNEEIMAKVYLELNSVDTLQITQLRGIGRGYAKRIIAYRDLLGGFYSITQLNEVYGLSQELINSISEQIWVDSLSLKQININIIDYQELKKHPYLSDYQAKSIIYYRETMGNFKSAEELTKHKLVDSKTLNRIRPYITLR